jgi:hypothetical protein
MAMAWPRVTWPSPAMATPLSSLTARIVVPRISCMMSSLLSAPEGVNKGLHLGHSPCLVKTRPQNCRLIMVFQALKKTFPHDEKNSLTIRPHLHRNRLLDAPVAQLDRVPDYESVGRMFESCRAHHEIKGLLINQQPLNFLPPVILRSAVRLAAIPRLSSLSSIMDTDLYGSLSVYCFWHEACHTK